MTHATFRSTLAGAALLAAALAFTGCGDDDHDGLAFPIGSPTPTPAPTATPGKVSAAAVVANYADILYANYNDAIAGAEALHDAIDAFVRAPNQSTLDAARAAWVAARPAYQQSEFA